MTKQIHSDDKRRRKPTARRRGPFKALRRRVRRLLRRNPWARPAAIALGLAAALGAAALLVLPALTPTPESARPEVEIAAPALETMERPAATAETTAAPTAAPGPELAVIEPEEDTSSLYLQAAAAGPDYADPAGNRTVSKTKVYREKSPAIQFDGDGEIHMGPSSEYSALEGVTTFRGSNYRDGGAYGTIPDNPARLEVVWQKRIHELDEWSGVGWTGQCSLVRWPSQTREQMNIVRAKRQKEGLVEAIYATLDGHIYFLDLDDGQETRKSIDIGAPIKGSLTVDPRGVPLLYCGQGIYEVHGKRVPCGTRVWSLIDQSPLFFLDGKDPKALRPWAAFDCSPLVDAGSDTMITAGENGVLYKIRLNTRQETGRVSIDPEVTRYVYTQHREGKLGTENSVAVYNSYVYFATNIGIIQCVDLNTMSLVWSFDAKDDIDASLVLEPEADGRVALYATNELDKRGNTGTCQMFKLNALTGELLWLRNSDPISQHDDNGGGGFGTPAVGKGELDGLVYFHICRTKGSKGMLYALDKKTGATVWDFSLGHHGWSSPTCVYSDSGKGYVLLGSSDSMLRLLDGLTGEEVASVKLKGNIEGTPAVFDDMIVVGTRSNRIFGIRIG